MEYFLEGYVYLMSPLCTIFGGRDIKICVAHTLSVKQRAQQAFISVEGS